MLDIKYSQNFYTNSKKASPNFRRYFISKDDLILDIGAGNGFLTKALLEYSKMLLPMN
jgi:16S rRNA A1518/A1519 N6-dimethyltransferase RsmA/KsgA/DIM1 with predicted DNA glycosylase/AP lyase activity